MTAPCPSCFADEPSIGETGCPARRLWVEGTLAELACAASGNPPPHVACAKLGDGEDPPAPAGPNVTRAHAGTYQCRATNAHGSALRNVTVAVECEWKSGWWWEGGVGRRAAPGSGLG